MKKYKIVKVVRDGKTYYTAWYRKFLFFLDVYMYSENVPHQFDTIEQAEDFLKQDEVVPDSQKTVKYL